jgi:hypothetical protein
MLYLIGSPPLSGMTIDIGARRLEGNRVSALRSLRMHCTLAGMSTKKLENLTIRLEPEVRVALAREAERDRRPMGNLIRNIVADWVAAHAAAQPAERRSR